MGFETGSDSKKIEKLENKVDDILDSQINSIGGNDNISLDSSLGQRNSASGDEGGVRSNEPIIHKITDIDAGGTPTGVFDKINLISSMIIVDHTSTPITLRFIQGPAKEGSKIKITPKKGKVLIIKSGGNILTSSDITISDTEFFILVKYSAAETIAGGAYKILKVGTTAGAGYDTIQEEGSVLTQRSIMNFIGATVTAVDNPGQSRTDITISAGAGGLLSTLTIDVDKNWNDKKITNLGGITMNGDIDLATFNIINIDQAKFVADSALSVGNTESIILLNTSSQFQFNTAETNDFAFSFDNDIGINFEHNIADPSRILSILSDSTDINSISIFNIVKNFPTSVSGQTIGQITYKAPTDAGGGIVEYAAIVGKIEDATAGTIDGSLLLEATLNNSIIPFMIINDGGSGEVKLFRDFNVNTQNIVNIDQSRYVIDSGVVATNTDTVILLNSNAQFQFNTDQINDFVFSFDNIEAFVLDRDDATNQVTATILSDRTNINSRPFLNLTRATPIPPSLSSIGSIGFRAGTSVGLGDVEYASIDSRIEDNTEGSVEGSFAINVVINNSITQFMRFNFNKSGNIDALKTLDMKTNPILNMGGETINALTVDASPVGSADFVMTYDASTASLKKVLLDNLPTIAGFLPLSGGTMSGNIVMDGNDITSVDDILMSGATSVINMNGGDISNFDVLQAVVGGGSSIQMLGGSINMDDGKIIDSDDITMHGSSRILAVGTTEFGIQIDNVSANVGSAGMIAIPVADITTVVTVALLNSTFGTHKGAMGLDHNNLTNSRLWVKDSDDSWLAFDYITRIT